MDAEVTKMMEHFLTTLHRHQERIRWLKEEAGVDPDVWMASEKSVKLEGYQEVVKYLIEVRGTDPTVTELEVGQGEG